VGADPAVLYECMPTRRRRSKALAAQTVDLAFAVPQVIAHRVARMADQKEMHRMGTEKFAAFGEAWTAMALEAWLANQKFALSFMQSALLPGTRQLNRAALDILASGMTPIRRRAVANARRLGRPRRKR
jgi:hypothetical protein